jgi:hypothetical protein
MEKMKKEFFVARLLSVKIVGLRTDIRTGDLPDTEQEC